MVVKWRLIYGGGNRKTQIIICDPSCELKVNLGIMVISKHGSIGDGHETLISIFSHTKNLGEDVLGWKIQFYLNHFIITALFWRDSYSTNTSSCVYKKRKKKYKFLWVEYSDKIIFFIRTKFRYKLECNLRLQTYLIK